MNAKKRENSLLYPSPANRRHLRTSREIERWLPISNLSLEAGLGEMEVAVGEVMEWERLQRGVKLFSASRYPKSFMEE